MPVAFVLAGSIGVHLCRGGTGDKCADPIPILSIPFVTAGSTCGFSDDYHETCPFPPGGAPDVVYSYTPSANTTVSIDLCESDYDTRVYIFAESCPGTPASGQAIACNDDACGVNGWRSRLNVVTLDAGTTYFMVIDGYGADCGNYQLSVAELGMSAGDRCNNAWEIPALPFADARFTCGLMDDYNEACPYSNSGAPDWVYRYVPTLDLHVNLDLCFSDYDTRLYIFAGTCPAIPASGQAVACNDDACGVNGWRSRLTNIELTAGVEYFVVIDGYGTDCGTFNLEMVEVPPAGPGESCEQPIEVNALPYAEMIQTAGISRHEYACQFVFEGAPEKVLRYVAPADEIITVRACSADFDPKVTVATGPCPLPRDLTPVAIACADDSCNADGLGARIAAVPLVAGETIWIVVDGNRAGEEGSVFVDISQTFAPDYAIVKLDEIEVPEQPIGLAISPGGDRLYVASFGADIVSVIDTATDTVINSASVGDGPYRLILTPNGTRLYICEYYGGTIRSLDAQTLALIDVLSYPGNPLGLAISPDGTRLWATNESMGTVRSWSIPEHVVQDTVFGLGSPREVIVSPDGLHVFVTDFYGSCVWKINTTDLSKVSVLVDETPQALAIAPDQEHLLVGNFGWDRSPDTIPVLRIADLALVARLRIGSGLEEMVFVPGTNRLFTTYWGYSHHPNQGNEEVGAGLGSIQVLRVPVDFSAIGDPGSPPILEVSEALITHLGDYLFGLAVSPDGSRVYASAAGYTGASPTEDHVSVCGLLRVASVPAASEWSLIAMSVLILAAGTVVSMKRRSGLEY